MNQSPKCKTQTIKLLVDDIGKNGSDLEFGDDFLDKTLKAQSMKGKTDVRLQ